MSDKLTEYKNYDELLKTSGDTLNSINVINAFDNTSVSRRVLDIFNNVRRRVNEARCELFRIYINEQINLRKAIEIEKIFSSPFIFRGSSSDKCDIIVFGEKIYTINMLDPNYDEFDNYFKKAENRLVELSEVIYNNIESYNKLLDENADNINQYIRKKGINGTITYKILSANNYKNNPVLKVSLASNFSMASDIIMNYDTLVELSLLNYDARPFLETLNYENVIKNIYETRYKRAEAEINKYIYGICKGSGFVYTKFDFDVNMHKKYDFRTGAVGPNFDKSNKSEFKSEFVSVINVINHFYKYKPSMEMKLELKAGSKYFYIPIYECKLNGDNYTIYDTKAGKKALLQVYKNGTRLGLKARKKIIDQFLKLGRKLVEDCHE